MPVHHSILQSSRFEVQFWSNLLTRCTQVSRSLSGGWVPWRWEIKGPNNWTKWKKTILGFWLQHTRFDCKTDNRCSQRTSKRRRKVGVHNSKFDGWLSLPPLFKLHLCGRQYVWRKPSNIKHLFGEYSLRVQKGTIIDRSEIYVLHPIPEHHQNRLKRSANGMGLHIIYKRDAIAPPGQDFCGLENTLTSEEMLENESGVMEDVYVTGQRLIQDGQKFQASPL